MGQPLEGESERQRAPKCTAEPKPGIHLDPRAPAFLDSVKALLSDQAARGANASCRGLSHASITWRRCEAGRTFLRTASTIRWSELPRLHGRDLPVDPPLHRGDLEHASMCLENFRSGLWWMPIPGGTAQPPPSSVPALGAARQLQGRVVVGSH
jgi:hypothetical protein